MTIRRQSLAGLVSPPPVPPEQPRVPVAAPAAPAPVAFPAVPAKAPCEAWPAQAGPLSAENREWLAGLDRHLAGERARTDARLARSRADSEQLIRDMAADRRLDQYRRDTRTRLWAMKMRLDQQIWNMNMDLRYGHLLRAAQSAP